MMHKNGYVLAIKHKEKFLRENSGKVYLPFDSEYSLYLKNTTDFGCLVKIEIDGYDITNQKLFYTSPRSFIEIRRFMLDGNLESGEIFKFVKKDHPDVQDPSNPSNGEVKATFYKEAQIVVNLPYSQWTSYPYYPYYPYYLYPYYTTFTDDIVFIEPYSTCSSSSTYSFLNAPLASSNVTSTGATVGGTICNQEFLCQAKHPDYSTETIISIKLCGALDPVTTKTKNFCPKCGKKQPDNAIYCFNCGVYLGS